MLKVLSYLLSINVATAKEFNLELSPDTRGLPKLTTEACVGEECNACVQVCPTDAIALEKSNQIRLDLGSCIACGLCMSNCPSGTIANDLSTRNARYSRNDLILSSDSVNAALPGAKSREKEITEKKGIFKRSFAIRVVATGCSACDLEVAAAGNPIFDMERFGVSIVASPRYADALLVTGPVSKGMQEPLLRCYEAMAEPRIVIAVGTCAVSGGMHAHGYADANGVDSVIPVDVYLPGCPPHPWSIIHAIQLAMQC